ncbi:hypothetical protein RYX36_037022 [Vicia faba]
MIPVIEHYTKDDADPKMIHAALDWACGPRKVECSTLLQGQPCYDPDNVIAHANYTFDSYYNNMGKTSDACGFKGVSTITTSDPILATKTAPLTISQHHQ